MAACALREIGPPTMTNKPHTLRAALASFPAALTPLTALDHWLWWRWELRKGIWTKPPYTTVGGRAKNNDPATWTSYRSALAVAQNDGRFDGLGFALLNTP